MAISLGTSRAFSSYSVKDLQKARAFYGKTLGLEVAEQPEGLALKVAGGHEVFLYPKANHQPATFTVLNFRVANIDEAVAQLKAQGVRFERYDQPDLKTDDQGIFRGGAERGPTIAWFTDPDGNILSVVQG